MNNIYNPYMHIAPGFPPCLDVAYPIQQQLVNPSVSPATQTENAAHMHTYACHTDAKGKESHFVALA